MPATLLVFSRDLRLDDNPALHAAASLNLPLICLYCFNEQDFKTNRYGLKSMGEHRLRFISEALAELDKQLHTVGQRLVITRGQPELIIQQLIQRYDISHLLYTELADPYKDQQWQRVEKQNPRIKIKAFESYTLFEAAQIPTSFAFPASFSKFRRTIEKVVPHSPLGPVQELPPPLRVDVSRPSYSLKTNEIESENAHKGGTEAANAQLKHYFDKNTRYPSKYKQTRNALEGWWHSCKLSPWLAQGCLSPRQIIKQLWRYEEHVERNDSTQWIYLELLWREYFQWYSYHYNRQLFAFKGIGQQKPLTSFYPQRFKQWCQGSTQWPLINACMKQLNQTGFMSNRGRQIVASCLVNELQIDWRYGASYFEEKLIDYDLSVNWGNWQYIAGVGADPRGGRHFNIEKQTQLYDPTSEFIHKWQGRTTSMPIDHLDAADWPVG